MSFEQLGSQPVENAPPTTDVASQRPMERLRQTTRAVMGKGGDISMRRPAGSLDRPTGPRFRRRKKG